ncbi:MAG TPA: alpha/beta hydrolase [Steroidobacteraceae bacterium]
MSPARTALFILTTILALYAALVAYVYVFQSQLVFLPEIGGRALRGTPANIGLAFEELRIPTPDGVTLHAWYIRGEPGAATVLFCHGNAGNISDRLEWAKILRDMGLGVLLFDYRGYGQSTGIPEERGIHEDARAVWDHLTSKERISPSRIVIFGESLGGAVAAHLAKDVTPAALIVHSAFTSVPDVASRFYWYLPVRLLARIRLPTADYIERVRAPVLIIHSRDDEIVPFSHAQTLLRRANDPKELIAIEGDHNTGFLLSEEKVREGLRRFVNAHGLRGELSPPASAAFRPTDP